MSDGRLADESRLSSEISVAQSVEPNRSAVQMPREARSSSVGPVTTYDLIDSRSSPRTESLVAAAVQWAERIMRKIDGVFPK